MIVDTSAMIAIVFGESEAAEFTQHISSERASMSAASYVECSVVIDRATAARLQRQVDPVDLRADLGRKLENTVAALHLHISPVTREQAELARRAHREFGPGSGSSAKLNFGDCFAYALAKDTREPLLFKGDDFRHTDVDIYRS